MFSLLISKIALSAHLTRAENHHLLEKEQILPIESDISKSTAPSTMRERETSMS
jgi:hypothetical protein